MAVAEVSEAWTSRFSGVSELSTVTPGEEEGQPSTTALFMACIVCIIFLIVAGVVVALLLASPEQVDDTDEAGPAPGGGGGGSTISLPPVAILLTRSPTSSTTPGAVGATGTNGPVVGTPGPMPTPARPTGTGPIAVVKELVCTVGPGAAVRIMIPFDGVCHYVYYTHVFVHEGNILATQSDASFNNFRRHIKYRTTTQGGLAFDYRYTTDTDITEENTTAILEGMKNANIKHYGVLNVVSRIAHLAANMERARRTLQALKSLQGGDRTRKTIIAIGLYKYDSNAWDLYKSSIQRAANEYPVDTVIAITSHLQFDSLGDCKVVPPDVLRARSVPEGEFVSIERHSELVKESFPYQNKDTVVGLSLVYGARLYQLRKGTTDLLDVPYADCASSFTTSMDVVCEIGSGKEISTLTTNVAISSSDSTKAAFWDTADTLREKVVHVLNLPVRRRFSWLYFDVHLADFLKRCTPNPMEKIDTLKREFGIGKTPTP